MNCDFRSQENGKWEKSDTEAVYREVVGEGLAPPEENETRKNGYARYKIYDNVVGRCLPCLKGGGPL